MSRAQFSDKIVAGYTARYREEVGVTVAGRVSDVKWRQQLASHVVTLAPAASPATLAQVEQDLGIGLPAELRGFLAESDGLEDRYRTPLIWPAAGIARENLEFRARSEFRALYMPFDPLLFFGAAGNGDQFFYRILDDGIRDADIYMWDHETDSRIWRAPGLARFLDEMLSVSPADQA